VGGYQTISGATGFIATPGASSIYNSSTDYRDIQSGQAIFVHNSTTSDVGVNFSEDCKKTGSRLVNRGGGMGTERQLLSTNLYTSSGILADGNAVSFDNSFSNKVDKDDALKISNAGENFGIRRNGQLLAVEARSAVSLTDTVFYDMHNLRQQSYQLLFLPGNMEPVRQAFFIDRYLNTEQPVSLTDSTVINFSVTSDAASNAADRFMLVFRTSAGPLSVSFVSVNAYRNNSFVQVEWKTENENNMDKYEIESSVDGIHFNSIGTVEALNLSPSSYNYTDVNPATGNNYYRIRSIEKDGTIKYSKVVKVTMEKVISSFSIYPNPIQHGVINLQFTDQPVGKYRLRLLNAAGATLFSETINYTGGTSVRVIEPGKYLPQGVYHIEILTPGGEREVLNFTK
jgi:hypothetical protein